MLMTRRKTFVALPGSTIIRVSNKQSSLERRIEELMEALRSQWQVGYEAALIELDIDPQTHIQSTRNPW